MHARTHTHKYWLPWKFSSLLAIIKWQHFVSGDLWIENPKTILHLNLYTNCTVLWVHENKCLLFSTSQARKNIEIRMSKAMILSRIRITYLHGKLDAGWYCIFVHGKYTTLLYIVCTQKVQSYVDIASIWQTIISLELRSASTTTCTQRKLTNIRTVYKSYRKISK